MKYLYKIVLLAFILAPIFSLAQEINNNTKSIHTNTNGTLTINFTTINNNGHYSPNHVMAVWIETSSGTFVRTIYKAGEQEDVYLDTWIAASSGNTSDAVTAATIQAHGSHQLIWDCKDKNGAVVTDGDYKLKFEFTDKDSQGPTASINFTKNNQAFDISPASQSKFTSFHLVFATDEDAISEIRKKSIELKIFPQPAKEQIRIETELKINELIQISIVSITGKLVKRIQTKNIQQQIDVSTLESGIYFIDLESENYHQIKRFVKL